MFYVVILDILYKTMTKGPEKPETEPTRLDLSTIIPTDAVAPPIDLAKKLGYVGSYNAPLSREMIDKHGVSLAGYNIYTNIIPQGEFACGADGCTQLLVEIRCCIQTVMEPDGTWYTMSSLARDPAIYEALMNTNRKAIICMDHFAAAVLFLKDEPKKDHVISIPISRGEEIRKKKKKKKKN
jgi:hypothetical protein